MIDENSIKAYHYCIEHGLVAKRQAMVLEAIATYPGLTDREHCVRLGYPDPNVFRPSRVALKKKAFIESAGSRTCEVSGMTAHTWRMRQSLVDGIMNRDRQENLFDE